ncbi:MAG: PocR ligand-binding domain-containing protein [Phycisphaerae bacterium]|nr:PocR ligand-binding domain-containing protein [Phycisphaerae bacterium]
MPEGFSIRCPHCQEWSNCDEDFGSKVVKTKQRFSEILDEISDGGNPSELLRCGSKRWICPASFESFIFDNEDLASECLESVSDKIWGIGRKFGLYKKGAKNPKDPRWGDEQSEKKYVGILFNTKPVFRRREIELELLIDSELVSRLISGIGAELDLSLTCYTANVFYPKGIDKTPEILWMPIEGYSQKPESFRLTVYNRFCEDTRNIMLDKLIKEFEDDNVGITNCPIGYYDSKNNLCGMRDGEPACERKPFSPLRKKNIPDWNHCPYFIKRRMEEEPCYNSDLELIKKVVEKVENSEKDAVVDDHKCPAGFTEIAFPVRVHDFLVGVAITGQIFYKTSDIEDVKNFIWSQIDKNRKKSAWKFLEAESDKLEKARQILIGSELQRKEQDEEQEEEQKKEEKREKYLLDKLSDEEREKYQHSTLALQKKNQEKERKKPKKARFLLDDQTVDERIDDLRPHLERFEEVAGWRYRDFRTKVEYTFREELLGYIDRHKMENDSFEEHLPRLLKRMREFWAFKAVYLTRYPFEKRTEEKEILTIAISDLDGGEMWHGYAGMPTGLKIKLDADPRQLHPTPALWNGGKILVGKGSPFKKMANLLVKKVPSEGYKFMVFIPVPGEVYTFIFAARDKTGICSLPHPNPEGISQFCQDFILEVCGEIVLELSFWVSNIKSCLDKEKPQV